MKTEYKSDCLWILRLKAEDQVSDSFGVEIENLHYAFVKDEEQRRAKNVVEK